MTDIIKTLIQESYDDYSLELTERDKAFNLGRYWEIIGRDGTGEIILLKIYKTKKGAQKAYNKFKEIKTSQSE